MIVVSSDPLPLSIARSRLCVPFPQRDYGAEVSGASGVPSRVQFCPWDKRRLGREQKKTVVNVHCCCVAALCFGLMERAACPRGRRKEEEEEEGRGGGGGTRMMRRLFFKLLSWRRAPARMDSGSHGGRGGK